jgi:hypothetical protein
MKLWFERWNVNARDASSHRRVAISATAAATIGARNSLAMDKRRGDSAGKEFEKRR